jgi:hypothetical protein
MWHIERIITDLFIIKKFIYYCQLNIQPYFYRKINIQNYMVIVYMFHNH